MGSWTAEKWKTNHIMGSHVTTKQHLHLKLRRVSMAHVILGMVDSIRHQSVPLIQIVPPKRSSFPKTLHRKHIINHAILLSSSSLTRRIVHGHRNSKAPQWDDYSWDSPGILSNLSTWRWHLFRRLNAIVIISKTLLIQIRRSLKY